MPEPIEYTYVGDRQTDERLKNMPCKAVRCANGKCVRGRNGSMLVQFENENIPTVIIGRLLRKVKHT